MYFQYKHLWAIFSSNWKTGFLRVIKLLENKIRGFLALITRTNKIIILKPAGWMHDRVFLSTVILLELCNLNWEFLISYDANRLKNKFVFYMYPRKLNHENKSRSQP